MADKPYEIELGIKLDTSDLQSQVNRAGDDIKPINIKVDAETKELTNTIKEALNSLSKGTKNALTLDTSKIEASLKDVADEIRIIKSSIGTLDGGDMKSLLATINQISTALDKTSNQFVELNRNLDALSKKDLSLNIGVKLGGSNSVANNSLYGDFVKDDVLPTLKKQEQSLSRYLAQYFNTNEFSAIDKLLSKSGNGVGGISGVIEIMDKLESPLKKGESLKDRMREFKNFINLIISSANMQGIDLSPVLSQFEKLPNELIETADNIRNGTKQVDESIDKLKQVFGGGIDAEGLSASLDPIVNDLKEIREAIVNLSKGVSFEGLTSSFNKLSESIDKLVSNVTLAKAALGDGFGNISNISSTSSVSSVNNAVTAARQTGQKIGETVSKSAQQSLNIDDVIDEQVSSIMQKYSIVGDKGSNAFEEIKQAVIECRSELNILENSDIGIDEEVFDTSRAVDKVTDAIANQMRAVNNLGDEYVDLANYIAKFNGKVHIPDFIKQERGDDYRSNRSSLGKAFTTGKGQDFADFITELNGELGQTIDLTNGEAAAFDDLLRKVELGRKQRDASKKSEKSFANNLSTEEILEQNGLGKEEIYDDAMSAVDAINKAEKQIAQTSTQSTNVVVQNEERKQQAYQETANQYNKITKDTSLVRDNANFRKDFDATNQAAQEAQIHFQELLADEKAVVSVTERFDDSNALKSFVVDIKRASGEVETLRYAMEDFSQYSGVDDDWRMVYKGGSTSDGRVEKQLEKHIKKANDLQVHLDEIKSQYSDANAPKSIKDSDHLEALNNQYNKVVNAITDVRNADNTTFTSMVSNAEKEKSALENMVREFRNAESVATSLRSKDVGTTKEVYNSKLDVLISKMRQDGVYTSGFESGAENLRSILSNSTDASGLVRFLNGLDKLDAGYKRASASVKEFNKAQKVGINVSGLESKIADIQRISPEINRFETEIDGAKVSVQSLLNDLKQVKTQGDFSVVNSRFKAFTDAAKAAGIAVEDMARRTKSIKDIEIDLGLGTFENQVSQIHDKFNSLSDIDGSLDKLRVSIKQVDDAYNAMINAADDESLIQAQREYAAAVAKTNNELKIQAREQRAANAKNRLTASVESLEYDMLNWLKDNSKAAKEYKGQIDALIDSLHKLNKADNLDEATVNGAREKFNNWTKDAKYKGLTGLNFVDSMKSKIKEYSVYFGAAEMFMYAEQGLRSMFEQVKLIDSAMTELKKVTNETDAAYDKFLTNAADRAKAIGTTIDGLVSSTADFARLGKDFDVAQELAEVANIYAVVGDEIDGVEGATESLVSTMAAFETQMNGMSDADFAMSIVDKFNEIGNNFAISSGGIGEALERSASSLMAANNTIDESIALITAANTVVQDPEAVGTAFKTISMRIRGAKTEMEELGLDTENMVDSTAKLRSEILALTGVDIMENG